MTHRVRKQRRSVLIAFGRALAARGLPSDRVEAALGRVARVLDLEAQVFCTPTSLFLAVGSPGRQTTHLVRVRPAPVDLGGLADVQDLLADLTSGRITVDRAARALDRLDDRGVPGRRVRILAFAVASASAAVFLGGGLAELLTVLLLGLGLGALNEVTAPRPAAAPIFEPLAALCAAVGAGLAVRAGWVDSAALTVLAALIVLVPGFSWTVAMGELAQGHWASGSARLAGTLVTFLSMGFGVALGRRLVPVEEVAALVPLPGWAMVPAAIAAGLAFAVLFRARGRDASAIVMAGLVAFGTARWAGLALGPELGAHLGALALATGSHLYERVSGRSALVPLVPGLVMLVPGSIGLRSVQAFLAEDVVSGMAAAFEMGLIAVALVAGLLLAHVLVPLDRQAAGHGSTLPREATPRRTRRLAA